jgi:hypothetical protein
VLEKISYLDLPNCYRISNGAAELVVATDIGPRLLRYSLAGGPNVLGEYAGRATATVLGEWKPWGGHRLWAAPERMPETYSPDNSPVDFAAIDELSVLLVQATDRAGIQKEITVRLDPDTSRAIVRHRITNRSGATLCLAPWAITIVRNGEAIVPLEPWRSHDEALLPSQPVVRWEFTDFTDPRLRLGRKYIRLQTDPLSPAPQKFGLLNKRGWCAHFNAGTLFVKRFPYVEGAAYADHGCNNEVYVEGDYLELESLGPLQKLRPEETAEHVEQWELMTGIDPGTTDESIDVAIKALVY